MAAGDGYYDANGIYIYGEADDISLFSDLLNTGMESVSTTVGNLNESIGLTHITTQAITGTSTFSLNNVFSSEYENYKVMITNFRTTAAGIVQAWFRMRLAGVNAAGATDYNTLYIRYYSAGFANQSSTGQSIGGMGYFSTGQDSTITFDIMRPAIADQTVMNFQGLNYQSDIATWIYATGSNLHKQAIAYDGITIGADAGTLSGTISVYGYRS